MKSACDGMEQISKIRKITYRNNAGDFFSLQKSRIGYKIVKTDKL